MPNLSALANDAILFENAYCVYPESIKGLFSVLCSRYPAFDINPGLCAKISTPSIASLLERAGYQTALFHSGRFRYLGMDEVVHHRGFQSLEDAGDIGGNQNSSFGIDEPATVERMLHWIDSLPHQERFFITYLPIAGHHPYDTPQSGPFPNGEINRYRNALHWGDAALGTFLNGLKARGLFQRTLFILFGDHSEAFGQHEGNFGHTLYLYEENVHVPWLIAAPGLIRGQMRVSGAASLIDAAPTILDLLGLSKCEAYQGSSLLESKDRMALFFTDYSLGLLGLRDGRWKCIHELESGRTQLYDLASDAGEKTNLAREWPGRVIVYRSRLQNWVSAQGDWILRH